MTSTTTSSGATRTLRTPRTRGTAIGPILILLGLWGAFVPFVGPYLGYALDPDGPWFVTWPRFWLELLPGVVTVVAGVIVTATANRISGSVAGWLGLAAGAWFAIGPLLWTEQIGMATGLGVVVAALAAGALGRFSVVGFRDVQEADTTARAAASPPLWDVPDQRTRAFERDPRWTQDAGRR